MTLNNNTQASIILGGESYVPGESFNLEFSTDILKDIVVSYTDSDISVNLTEPEKAELRTQILKYPILSKFLEGEVEVKSPEFTNINSEFDRTYTTWEDLSIFRPEDLSSTDRSRVSNTINLGSLVDSSLLERFDNTSDLWASIVDYRIELKVVNRVPITDRMNGNCTLKVLSPDLNYFSDLSILLAGNYTGSEGTTIAMREEEYQENISFSVELHGSFGGRTSMRVTTNIDSLALIIKRTVIHKN